MTQKAQAKNSGDQFARTKANKIRKLTKQLAENPNNESVRKALEFWQTHDKKVRTHKKHKLATHGAL